MFDQLDRLEDAAIKMGMAHSCMQFLGGCFTKAEPSVLEFVAGYDAYSNLFHLTIGIIADQRNAIRAVVDELYEMKKAGDGEKPIQAITQA